MLLLSSNTSAQGVSPPQSSGSRSTSWKCKCQGFLSPGLSVSCSELLLGGLSIKISNPFLLFPSTQQCCFFLQLLLCDTCVFVYLSSYLFTILYIKVSVFIGLCLLTALNSLPSYEGNQQKLDCEKITEVTAFLNHKNNKLPRGRKKTPLQICFYRTPQEILMLTDWVINIFKALLCCVIF